MRSGPNTFAYVVLVGWSCFCFLAPRLMAAHRAVAIGIVVGILFLPQRTGWDLPFLPQLTSYQLPSLALLLGLITFRSGRLRASPPFTGFDLGVLGLLVFAVGTVLTNGDALATQHADSALSPYDWISQSAYVVLTFGIPYYLGRACFRSGESLRLLFQVIVVGALAYSLLALWEMRMSPQLHRVIFGFHQHQFGQSIRSGGYRPTIFMTHGLSVADYFLTAGIAAAALTIRGQRIFGSMTWPIVGWLCLILASLRSFGALLIGLAAIPIVALAKPRAQLTVAICIAGFVSTYFVGRAVDWVPLNKAVHLAEIVSENRANSLRTRLEHESRLFEKASERVLFGWGMRGRSRIYRSDGKDTTLSDGYWIIYLGREGALGVACRMLMFLGPIAVAYLNRRTIGKKQLQLIAPLSLLIAFKSFDMILNATSVTALTVLLAGALAGQVEMATTHSQTRLRRGLRSRRAVREHAQGRAQPHPSHSAALGKGLKSDPRGDDLGNLAKASPGRRKSAAAEE